MPMIDYRCNDCGEKFEELVRSAQHVAVCPKCGGQALTQIYEGLWQSGTPRRIGAAQPHPCMMCEGQGCGAACACHS